MELIAYGGTLQGDAENFADDWAHLPFGDPAPRPRRQPQNGFLKIR